VVCGNHFWNHPDVRFEVEEKVGKVVPNVRGTPQRTSGESGEIFRRKGEKRECSGDSGGREGQGKTKREQVGRVREERQQRVGMESNIRWIVIFGRETSLKLGSCRETVSNGR
jgi:hypothetical protein